jgi:hypothetical protein
VRIPERLWRIAVEQAAVHGVHKAAQALRLDYYCLQRRLMESGAGGKRRGPAAAPFVELMLPAAARSAHCQLEMGDRSGGKVRVDVSGLSTSELAAFVRAVAGQEGNESCSR